ncbi:MAG TPA: hypothetical protein DCF89_10395 [Flavobacteriales bacterium]|nr:hypothetical protein [Flavobacteriales bacterium]
MVNVTRIMKYLLTSILLLAFVSGLMAQNFVYPTGQHRTDTIFNENYESFEIRVVTPTPEDITFRWQLLSNTFDPNWSCSVCDYTGCYVGFPANAAMTAITAAEMAAGTFGFIKCNMTCGLNYGEGKVEIYVFDQNDYSRGDTVSFFVSWPDPSISTIQENELRIGAYPNPVESQLTVHNPSSENGVVVVTDVLGKVVQSANLNSRSLAYIDFSGVRKGVYLVNFRGEEGLISTKKVIKK